VLRFPKFPDKLSKGVDVDHLLEQLTLHPKMAVAAGAILLASLVLVGLKRTEGATLLLKILGLALLAWSFGLAASVQHLINIFHGMAQTGSGGYGTVAAGLGESEGALLLGLLPALLALVAGLLFARGGTVNIPAGAEPRLDLKPWILVSLTLLSILVAALSVHTLWLHQLVASIVLPVPSGTANPHGAVDVAATSQRLSRHIMGLGLLAHAAILGSAGLILALFLSGTRALAPRQSSRGRALAAILLVLCLIATVVVWRQYAGFYESAMTGQPS
jgi:hypothetical protein